MASTPRFISLETLRIWLETMSSHTVTSPLNNKQHSKPEILRSDSCAPALANNTRTTSSQLPGAQRPTFSVWGSGKARALSQIFRRRRRRLLGGAATLRLKRARQSTAVACACDGGALQVGTIENCARSRNSFQAKFSKIFNLFRPGLATCSKRTPLRQCTPVLDYSFSGGVGP